MAGVFLSYRRNDAPGHAGRLYDLIQDRFGAGSVFMDVAGHLRPGQDFVATLDALLARAQVLVAVIGPRWQSPSRRKGGQTTSDDDYVVKEISRGLQRGIPVIPVLVQGASMPPETRLPQSIAALSRRQAVGVRDDRWNEDVRPLVDEIARLLTTAGTADAQRRTTSLLDPGEAGVVAPRRQRPSAEEFEYDPVSKQLLVLPPRDTRLALERSLVEQYMPDFELYWTAPQASVRGRWMSNLGQLYTLRITVPPGYPDECPKTYVESPSPLLDHSGTPMLEHGTSVAYMTWATDRDDATQITTYRPEYWEDKYTFIHAIHKALLWIVGYEGHRETGMPISSYFVETSEAPRLTKSDPVCSDRHEDVLQFMLDMRDGIHTEREMVYDPRSKKFVVRSPIERDGSAKVSREDLQLWVSWV
jgi:hypothetical protein